MVPILVTYTKNDKAVGMAYPLASRINGDKTAAFGDENDVFGGLGRNGAQQMQAGETVAGRLLPVGSAYAFQAGKFFNLEASEFIKAHGDITGKEVAPCDPSRDCLSVDAGWRNRCVARTPACRW